jgi:hypothetical protein
MPLAMSFPVSVTKTVLRTGNASNFPSIRLKDEVIGNIQVGSTMQIARIPTIGVESEFDDL